jgi:hypothetical protein
VDRTFVYSSPAAVGSPSAFGRVRLVDKIEPDALKPLGRALLPLALTQSANYAWLYGTVCVSRTIEGSVTKLEGKLLDADGKVRKTSTGSKKNLDGGFTLWTGSWELFDLPPGVYTLEVVATDKAGPWSRRGPRRCCTGARRSDSGRGGLGCDSGGPLRRWPLAGPFPCDSLGRTSFSSTARFVGQN